MKIRREVKVGIFGIIMLVVAYWGINFLKGVDILSANHTYHVVYDKSNNIEISSPVLIRGIKVGTVTKVAIKNVHDKVEVELNVKSKYKIPSNSVAVIVDKSLLGGKAIDIQIGDASTILENGDEIAGIIDDNLGKQIDELKNKVTGMLDELTATLSNLNKILDDNNIKNIGTTLGNVKDVSTDLRTKLETITSDLTVLTGELKNSAPAITATMNNLAVITDSLQTSLPILVTSVNGTVNELDKTIAALNSDNGTIGKFMNDPALYNHRSDASNRLNLLLEDLKANPKRYVHFSVFGGGKDKEPQTKPDKNDKKSQK